MIRLPALNVDLEQLSRKPIPLGIVFDTHEKARAKADLIDLANNWSPIAKIYKCQCNRWLINAKNCYYCSHGWLSLVDLWLDAAKEELTNDKIDAALQKAWKICGVCGTDQPSLTVEGEHLVFTWPGAKLIVTDTYALYYLDDRQVDLEEFKVKFSG